MDIYGFVSRLLVLAVLVAAAVFGICRTQAPEVPDPAEPALSVSASPSGEEFANIIISSVGEVSLERAYLLVNGETRGSFAAGSLRIRVYDGDILALDCRAYERELSFTVEVLSSSVEGRYLPPRFSCREETAILGFVVIR